METTVATAPCQGERGVISGVRGPVLAKDRTGLPRRGTVLFRTLLPIEWSEGTETGDRPVRLIVSPPALFDPTEIASARLTSCRPGTKAVAAASEGTGFSSVGPRQAATLGLVEVGLGELVPSTSPLKADRSTNCGSAGGDGICTGGRLAKVWIAGEVSGAPP